MALSKRQWESLVRKIAANSKQIKWTEHAKQQMKARHITMPMALDALSKGTVKLEPEPDIRTGDTICRMERYSAGREIGICVALTSEKAADAIVVTALIIRD
ncbi:Protein of unknown function DUF4258 [Burkholderiaceae bacterium]